jgi:glutaminyl-tRNA synthetase
VKLTITNYNKDEEFVDAVNNPEDENAGTRKIPFSSELFIERKDFEEEANRKFWGLTIGREVRLKYAYFVKCEEVVKDAEGNIIEIKCTYDPESKGGKSPDGRKVKGTLHWVSAKHAVDTEIRLYDRLFMKENPEENDENFIDNLNPDSLNIITAKIEPSVKTLKAEDNIQLERMGYFVADIKDFSSDKPVLNQTVPLRDNWKNK